MDTHKAYNVWASQYDTNKNRTRDLEALALRQLLPRISFSSCLEIGCGTGKNTVWLMERSKRIMAVDLSEQMLEKAKEKVPPGTVEFMQADITRPWVFAAGPYDLVSFSLVLEHIQDLDHVFSEASRVLARGGHLYIGELHPIKQYIGTKARFDTEEGRHVLKCFDHHISDFIRAARKQGFSLLDIEEHFDDNDRGQVPRVLAMLLKKE
jgi:ubiquinone/menaquinone biosynthesis C-methylase UbiE